ncbi:MAG: Glyoxalase/bleomycin resistance protein/dioxygenase [Acidobacteria bacterium]|nr:Glyoxalase/bleomycin resistance protein/dioxygenase [Acidobacteriota bacterium]
MEITSHPHGSFCFAELSTTDMERDKRFYAGLLGWDTFDVPSAAGGYSLFRLRGLDVAGLHLSRQGPCGWLTYVSVGDADQASARARELGAEVEAPPFDVPGIGRMSMFRDPAGGRVALWQEAGHPGARLVGEPGAMCFNELLVLDVAAAKRFYSGLFGWDTVEAEAPARHDTLFRLGEQVVAGAMAIGPDWGPVKPRWQVYFAVEDCGAAMDRARNLGGSVSFGPLDVPKAGRLALLTDAGGAAFLVIQPV